MRQRRAVLATISQPRKVSYFRNFSCSLFSLCVAGEVVDGREEEATGAAGRVGDGLHRLGAHAFHHGLDQGARREVLARAALGVLGVLLQEALVDVALHIGAQQHPALAVDQLDQLVQLGRVGDLVLALHEDVAQHAGLLAQLVQQLHVVALQLGAALVAQALPVEVVGDVRVAVVRRLAVLIGHLQEQQVGELLQVVAVAHAVIAQGVAEVPDFVDDGGGGHGDRMGASGRPGSLVVKDHLALGLQLAEDLVSRDQRNTEVDGCCGDHRIGQFQAVAQPQVDGQVLDGSVDLLQLAAIQETVYLLQVSIRTMVLATTSWP
jgi:hypothetical protein